MQATITNIDRLEDRIRVFYTIDGKEESRVFLKEQTKDEILKAIQARVDEFRVAEVKEDELKKLIGTIIK